MVPRSLWELSCSVVGSAFVNVPLSAAWLAVRVLGLTRLSGWQRICQCTSVRVQYALSACSV